MNTDREVDLAGRELAISALKYQFDRLAAAIAHSASNTPPAFAAIEIVRALDGRCFSALASRREAGECVHGADLGWYDLSKAPWFGASRALSILLDDRVENQVQTWLGVDDAGIEWAEETLTHCETIARLEHWLAHARDGNARVELTHRGFTIWAESSPYVVEALERDAVHSMDMLSRLAQKGSVEELRDEREGVIETIQSTVSVRNRSTSYSADAVTADFYTRAGILTAQQMWNDQETFDGETKFGGDTFNLYRATAGILIGHALEHVDAVSVVGTSLSAIERRNTLTIVGRFEDLAAIVASRLGSDIAEAARGLRALTLTPKRAEEHGRWPAPLPPLVQTARDEMVWSIAGTLAAPFSFMLDHLKATFRRDWDAAVDSREGRFRSELYKLFPAAAGRFTCLSRSARIREGGRTLTDIDAIVLDRASGDLALFQLKWQDSVGFASSRLASARKNFIDSTTRWIRSVRAWLADRSLQQAGEDLGFERADASAARTVYLFVIGRNFANFSGATPVDDSAVYATWPQLLAAAWNMKGADWPAPLSALYQQLRACSPHDADHPQVRPAAYRIGSVEIRVEPVVGS